MAEREILDLTDRLVEMVPLESRVIEATQAPLVPLALLELLVLPALLVRPVNKETEESLVHKDLQDPQDLREQEECLVHKDHEATRVRLVRAVSEGRKDTEASPVCRVSPDLLVKLETREPLDLQDLLDNVDHLDQLALLERMVRTVCQDLLDLLDLEVALERRVLLVPLETLDPLVLQVPPAQASTCLPSLVWVRLRNPPIL